MLLRKRKFHTDRDCWTGANCLCITLHALASEVTGRQHLRSAAQQKLIVPRFRRKMFGCQAYSVASLSVWNVLPDTADSLRDPELTLDTFRHQLKTYFFTLY